MTTADEALRATSTPGLLRASYALTHRMSAFPEDASTRIGALRKQRNLIEAEILRREREAVTLLRTARPSYRSPQSWYRRRTEVLR